MGKGMLLGTGHLPLYVKVYFEQIWGIGDTEGETAACRGNMCPTEGNSAGGRGEQRTSSV